MTATIESSTIPTDYIRLHITPFNENLFGAIIPDSIRRVSKNPSFHQLQTFPERNYGFVELPRSEAEKLKKKLNGSILKGQKVSIEEARPMPKRKSDAIEAEKAERKRARKDAKAKQQSNVINGHQLEEGRHVKRGWADDKQKRQKSKSKDEGDGGDTKDKHTLFKTVVPPNLADVPNKKESKTKKASKSKSKKNEAVVEEFGQSKKSFVTSQAGPSSGEVVGFEDGKGWVDIDGNVVEAVKSGRRNADLPGQRLADRPLSVSASSKPSRDTVEILDQVQKEEPAEEIESEAEEDSDSDSDPGSSDAELASSDSDAAQSEAENVNAALATTVDQDDVESNGSKSSASDDATSSTHGAQEKDNEPVSATTASDTREVHPLEALYKRKNDGDNKLQLAPIQTSFSFFSDSKREGSEAEAGDDEDMRPITPYTSQDMEYRRRSAAPTPDTAAIGGRFGFPFGGDADEDGEAADEDDEESDDARKDSAVTGNGEESAFRKFFYEKRGETDRAWKKRRREAKKLQRQRENRRLSRRVV